MTPEQVLGRYHDWLQHRDLDRVMSLITEDATYWFSNETAYHGRTAIRTAIEKNFATIQDETYRVCGIRWLARDRSVAVCAYEYNWSGTIQGTVAAGSGRGTNVFCLVDGDWQIAHEHLSRGKSGLP